MTPHKRHSQQPENPPAKSAPARPDSASSRTLLEDRHALWIVAGLILLLFATANLPWQLDDYDQAKQAFTSFQMVREGRWLYQQTPHAHVATKPPFAAWISAALFEVTRSWEIAWRLPSFIAAVAIAALLFRVTASAFGAASALVAFSAFGLNLLSPRLATLVRTDMLLALAVFLAGLLIWQKVHEQKAWKPRDRISLFLLLTAAMLIKGPIVYAFLLPGPALFEWRRVWNAAHDRVSQSAVTAWPGWWPWIASLGVFLLWVAGGIFFVPGFFDEVVLREFLGRFGETVHRPQPLYFYWTHLLHKFAPWSVLLVAMACLDLRARNWRLRLALRQMQPGTCWLLCWIAGGLVVMSLVPSKRVDRIFPVVPPLCLLLATLTSRAGPLRGTCFLEAALVFAIFFAGGYTTWKIVSGYRQQRDALAVFGRAIRTEAEMHRWRYEVVSARDEGLLLYLRKTHFIEPNRAVAEWNAGKLDALVASSEKASTLMPRLTGAVVARLKLPDRQDQQAAGYVLIRR